MRELIILIICLALYVTAVEYYQAKVEIGSQGQLTRQEQSFVYVPPQAPVSSDGTKVVAGSKGK
jgi:hypothetical protein